MNVEELLSEYPGGGIVMNSLSISSQRKGLVCVLQKLSDCPSCAGWMKEAVNLYERHCVDDVYCRTLLKSINRSFETISFDIYSENKECKRRVESLFNQSYGVFTKRECVLSEECSKLEEKMDENVSLSPPRKERRIDSEAKVVNMNGNLDDVDVDGPECQRLRDKLHRTPPAMMNSLLSSEEFKSELSNFLSSTNFERFCSLNLGDLVDESVLSLLNVLFEGQMVSRKQAEVLIREALWPKISTLSRPASRTLLSTVMLCAKHHTKPLLDCILLPAMLGKCGEKSIPFANEIIGRLVKDGLEEDMRGILFRSFCERCSKGEMEFDSWDDTFLQLLQTILSAKFSIEEGVFGMFVDLLEVHSNALNSKPKFGSLLFICVLKRKENVLNFVKRFEAIADKHSSLMRASLISALKKID